MERLRWVGSGALAEAVRGAVVGGICCLLVGEPLLAAAPVLVKQTAPVGIGGDARVLHALNRFTFGPRPGDVAAVEKMGLDKWFERQLNPESIDDSAFEQRLGAFPAMRMSQTEMMERYPNPQVIRMMVKQNLPLPSDPTERAIYADQIAFYELREAAKAGNGGVAQKGGGKALKPMAAMDGTTSDDAAVARGMAALTDGETEAMDAAKAGAKAEAEGKDPLAVAPDEHVETMYAETDARRVLAMGPDARVAAILRMKAPELVAFRRSLSKKELVELVAGLSPEQRETLAVLPGSLKVIGAETLQTRMLRDVYSDRQLEAVMTDFWLNHFNVYVKKSALEPYLIPAYEREVIRPRALGKFEDLLVATAKSPAMLVYLDNWQSTGPDSQAVTRGAGRRGLFGGLGASPAAAQAKKPQGLNENYGRELMELHTLGVGGGYTQADVTQVAKVFTGWTIEKPYRGGTYQFAANRHEPGSKVVLGKTIPEAGEKEGLEVLHMLAGSPATARFVSTKLAVRFVSDDPPATLVDRMTKAFLASDGDMKVVLRTMFQAPEFWSPMVYRAKVKTPLEFVVSAVRASDAEVKNPLPLVQALDKLGMPLYGMQTPNGYSWKQDQWVSTGALVSRMNFALVLSGDRVNGVRTNWPGLLGESGVTAVGLDAGSPEAVKERKLEGMLLGVSVSERTRKTVLAQFNDEGMQGSAVKEFGWAGGVKMGLVVRVAEEGERGGFRVRFRSIRRRRGWRGCCLGRRSFNGGRFLGKEQPQVRRRGRLTCGTHLTCL